MTPDPTTAPLRQLATIVVRDGLVAAVLTGAILITLLASVS